MQSRLKTFLFEFDRLNEVEYIIIIKVYYFKIELKKSNNDRFDDSNKLELKNIKQN